MTTFTIVVGMLSLAIGLCEGVEVLQPLAVIIVSGLTFAVIVSLFWYLRLLFIVVMTKAKQFCRAFDITLVKFKSKSSPLEGKCRKTK